jgi:hypothetical protein
MDRKKIMIVIGVLTGLLILVLLFSSLGGGEDLGPKLAGVIERNITMQEASDLAKKEAGDFDLRSSAATASIVISSDNSPLSDYFVQQFELTPPVVNQGKIDQLSTTQGTAAFDDNYQIFMREELQLNLTLLSTLVKDVSDPDIKAHLEEMSKHQTVLLAEFAP